VVLERTVVHQSFFLETKHPSMAIVVDLKITAIVGNVD
jgi:hypothetical protein